MSCASALAQVMWLVICISGSGLFIGRFNSSWNVSAALTKSQGDVSSLSSTNLNTQLDKSRNGPNRHSSPRHKPLEEWFLLQPYKRFLPSYFISFCAAHPLNHCESFTCSSICRYYQIYTSLSKNDPQACHRQPRSPASALSHVQFHGTLPCL